MVRADERERFNENNRQKRKKERKKAGICRFLCILCLACLMTGCRKEIETTTEQEEVENRADSEDTSVPEEETENISEENDIQEPLTPDQRLIWSDQTVAFIKEDGGLTKLYEIQEGFYAAIEGAVYGQEDEIYVLVREDSPVRKLMEGIDWDSRHTILCLDESGNVLETVATLYDRSNVSMVFHQGKLYVYYIFLGDNWEWQSCWSCYEKQADGTYAEAEDELCSRLDSLSEEGYTFCDGAGGLKIWQDSGLLIGWKEEAATLTAFDQNGEKQWEAGPEEKLLTIEYYAEGIWLGQTVEGESRLLYLYEVTPEGEWSVLGTLDGDGDTVLAIQDGEIYYRESVEDVSGYYGADVYCCDLYGQDATFLFSERYIPGQPRCGVDYGFHVRGGRCYYIASVPGLRGWYSCDVNGGSPVISDLLLQEEEYPGTYDIGTITAEGDSVYCPDCGELLCRYYLEEMALSEEVIPNADAMNRILQEKYLERLESAEDMAAGVFDGYGHVCDEYTALQTWDLYYDGATQFSFVRDGEDVEHTVLQIAERGYEFWGGAHGYPIRNYMIFSEEDGSLVTLEKVIGIDEDAFRTLAAEYTLADYKASQELEECPYFDFDTEEEFLYQKVYEYAGFDCLLRLTKEGVMIEYSPYQLGPYVAGYIEVLIPYEELGVTLRATYGTEY
ncbi:MAG: RsiV family protein [Lachnospiraceae bacterium]